MALTSHLSFKVALLRVKLGIHNLYKQLALQTPAAECGKSNSPEMMQHFRSARPLQVPESKDLSSLSLSSLWINPLFLNPSAEQTDQIKRAFPNR